MAGPGVIVTTATRSGPSAPLRSTSGQYFAVGLSERGDTTKAIKLNSMADYDRLMGARVTYGALYDDLTVFFAEGGTQAYVARLVGPGAIVGTITLQDRAVSPQPTLRIDAQNPGAWSTQVSVAVTDGSQDGTYKVVVTTSSGVTETYDNLTLPSDAVSAMSASVLVRATDLGSATAAPANQPALQAATALSAGSDDRVNVTTTEITAALDKFTNGLGDGAVGAPGYGSTVHTIIDNHCRTTGRRIGLLSGGLSASIGALQGLSAAINTEWCGLFTPWVKIPDGSGGLRTVSPEGYIAAMRNRAHDQIGPWRAAAGEIAVARYVAGLDQEYTHTDIETLHDSRINAIRVMGSSIRNYGWKSLSTDQNNYAMLTGRDTLNRLLVLSEETLETFIFEVIDGRGQLLSRVGAALIGEVEPIRAAGGLYQNIAADGTIIDMGYKVDVGPTVNTVYTLGQNQINAILSARVSPTGELINLQIIKVGVTGAV